MSIANQATMAPAALRISRKMHIYCLDARKSHRHIPSGDDLENMCHKHRKNIFFVDPDIFWQRAARRTNHTRNDPHGPFLQIYAFFETLSVDGPASWSAHYYDAAYYFYTSCSYTSLSLVSAFLYKKKYISSHHPIAPVCDPLSTPPPSLLLQNTLPLLRHGALLPTMFPPEGNDGILHPLHPH